MSNEIQKELDEARKSHSAFLAERIVDTQQYGFEVEYPRRSLYERVTDAIGQSALFGLFLAGFRAGRKFEASNSGTPRIEKLDVNLPRAAEREGVKPEGGLFVFDAKSLRAFASRVVREASGRNDIGFVAGSEEKVADATVDGAVAARLKGITDSLRASNETFKRDELARQLWIFEQRRAHGVVIGKWDDVGARYRQELSDHAVVLLELVEEVDRRLVPASADRG